MAEWLKIDSGLAEKLGVPIAELVEDKAKVVKANMKRLAPEDTTALEQSIDYNLVGHGDSTVAQVGVTAGFEYKDRRPEDYADYVEGTKESRSKPQPFIKPALLQARVN